MPGIMKRAGCILTAFALVATLCTTIVSASTATKDGGGRSIAIVLDNSGSMIKKQEKFISRWAEATYALRTFLYMVDDNDKIGLFTVGVSESGMDASDHQNAATISVDLTKDNIDKVLENVGISPVTAIYGLDAAYNWVRESKSAEQWVVILSDGTFYDGNRQLPFSESVGERAGKDENKGIHTIFIGLEFDPTDQNVSSTDYLSINNTLSSGRGIEDTILEISSEIYKMKELNLSTDMIQDLEEFSYDSESGIFTWATQPGLSTYLNQVVIIAQRNGMPPMEPETAADSRIQMIRSDTSFSWYSKDEKELSEFLETYNNKVKQTFQLGDADAFQKGIQATFLKKYCYIGTYSGSELGEKIEFQAPPGDYTYRIYYELSDEIRPEFAVTQNGVTRRADSTGALPIIEGSAEIDYSLYAGEIEIPKELQVINPELREFRVEGVAADEQTNQYAFFYDDIGENTYSVSVDFLGDSYAQTIEVGIDLQKYSFRIVKGQKINIDRPPEESWLYIETQLPPNWLRSHLNGHLQVNAEEGSAIQFDTSSGRFRIEGSRICVPVSYGDNLDLSPVMVKAVFTVDGAVSLKDEASVKLTQDKPEIISRLPDSLAWLGIPTRMKIPVAEISAQGGSYMMESVSIQDASVEGSGNLTKVKLEYDDQTKKIFLYADPIQAWKLLSSGETQGYAVLSGTVYRHDEKFVPDIECPVTIAWRGTLAWSLIFYAIIVLLLMVLLAGTFFSLRGSLVLLESVNRCRKSWFHNHEYYLDWKEGGLWCDVTRNVGMKISPWFFPVRIKLLLPDLTDLRAQSNGIQVVLRGTKNGYEILTRSCKEFRSKGFEVSSSKLDYGSTPIKFEYRNHVCYLHMTRRRNRLACLGIFTLVWLIAFGLVLVALRKL